MSMGFLKTVSIIVLLLAFFGVGQAYYDENPDENVYNLTNQLQWNSSLFTPESIDGNLTQNLLLNKTIYSPHLNTIRIKNIVYKFADFVGYIVFEAAKFGIEFGFEHPEYNFMTMMWVLIVYALAVALFPFIIPLIVLLILCGIYIWKFIKWLKNRKKRKDESSIIRKG